MEGKTSMDLRRIMTIFLLSALLITSASAYGQAPAPAKTVVTGEVESSLNRFNNVLQLLEDNYATTVDSEKAVYGAIDAMLRTLDPHSRFSDPKSFAQMIEDQRGRYYGLGITVTVRFGKVTVVSRPAKNSPAEKADLRVGDVISKVNGESTKDMDLNTVVSKIKGPRGTPVQISIRSEERRV